MKCSICGEDVGKYGNNAYPINDGKCCDLCNMTKVLPERLKCMGKAKKSNHQEGFIKHWDDNPLCTCQMCKKNSVAKAKHLEVKE